LDRNTSESGQKAFVRNGP